MGSPGSASAGREASTDGRARSSMASSRGSSAPTTQAPSRVMPTGTTSNRSRSRLASTLPAETQEIACSPLRPPNTTATRTRLAMVCEGRGSRRPVTHRSRRAGAHAPQRGRHDQLTERARQESRWSSFSARRVVVLGTASRRSRQGESPCSAQPSCSLSRTARSHFSGRRCSDFDTRVFEPGSPSPTSGRRIEPYLDRPHPTAVCVRIRVREEGARLPHPSALPHACSRDLRGGRGVNELGFGVPKTETRRVESRDSACRERRRVAGNDDSAARCTAPPTSR